MARYIEIADLTIRRMTESDLDSVMHVEAAANTHGWRRRTFVDSIRNGCECWVIDEPLTESYTIAHAVLGIAVDTAELYNLSVDPIYQGQRVGSLLLDHMLEVSKRRQMECVMLEVRVSNNRAIKLYKSRGFSRVGYREDYYQHDEMGREDAYVLQANM